MEDFDFMQFLYDTLEGLGLNLIYFLIGFPLGFILFIIIFKILTTIGSKKVFEKERVILPNDSRYKVIIQEKAKYYQETYSKAPIKEKVTGIGNIVISMLNEISKIYYPNSEEPIFEISPDQLVDFLDYFVKRINYTIDKVLTNNLKIIDPNTKLALKDMKLSAAVDFLNSSKDRKAIEVKKEEEVPKKKGFFTSIKDKVVNAGKSIGKNIAVNYTEKVINNEFYNVINDLGEDINKLYTNQKLIFTDYLDNDDINKENIDNKKSFLNGILERIKKVGEKHD